MEDFFENANIFITGGTGFIGKVLIEKLLRSQNNINKLYILLRSKKEKNEQDRIKEDIFDQPVFDKLKEINPNFMDKVVVVCGDILQPQLGISEKDKLTLFDK
ncbi:Male sterility protein, partial [Popillia japonica]